MAMAHSCPQPCGCTRHGDRMLQHFCSWLQLPQGPPSICLGAGTGTGQPPTPQSTLLLRCLPQDRGHLHSADGTGALLKHPGTPHPSAPINATSMSPDPCCSDHQPSLAQFHQGTPTFLDEAQGQQQHLGTQLPSCCAWGRAPRGTAWQQGEH